MLSTYFRIIVGSFILLSVILTVYVNQQWMWFTVFIGVNLIQSAFTKWCLLEVILVKLGVKRQNAATCAAPMSRTK
ncbi:MAG: sulfurtransferase [Flavobacteriaceae bacterium]|nr:sulfurtransferase [Flavobacteriaceae bacterium]